MTQDFRRAVFASAAVFLCMNLASFLDQAYAQGKQPKVQCTDRNKKRAKQHHKRGEAHKTLKDYQAAVAEYLAGYEFCARPFLLFNAAQAHWLDGNLHAALEMYERYLGQDPAGSGAATARERFFQAAEKSRQEGAQEKALEYYQRYLALDPKSENAGRAREQVRTLTDAIAKRENSEAAELEEAKREEARREAARRKAEEERRERERAVASGTPQRSGGSWKPWATTGSGALVVVLGGVLQWRAQANGEAYDRQFIELCATVNGCREEDLPADVRDQLSTAYTQQRLAVASYIVGGAALSVGLVWLFMKNDRASTDGASQASARRMFLTPWAGPQVVGGSWQVHF